LYKFRVKQLRESLGMTQREVCVKADLADSAYRNIESNRVVNVRTDTLFKLKIVFNLNSLDELFDFDSPIEK